MLLQEIEDIFNKCREESKGTPSLILIRCEECHSGFTIPPDTPCEHILAKIAALKKL